MNILIIWSNSSISDFVICLTSSSPTHSCPTTPFPTYDPNYPLSTDYKPLFHPFSTDNPSVWNNFDLYVQNVSSLKFEKEETFHTVLKSAITYWWTKWNNRKQVKESSTFRISKFNSKLKSLSEKLVRIAACHYTIILNCTNIQYEDKNIKMLWL